ncbi:Fungalysin metallopeptidase-domain-containing protein [Phascolomyces articulosus]|uniref:Extracellular metalloproteinase n=1 Tax=Phascolomyces articulosus TaxID=60185 RepID=A0AAD5PFH8_9FUNG|nr:Fungalysin metallopeptidase-domain-containing protein [Phascolomyces articulosus]
MHISSAILLTLGATSAAFGASLPPHHHNQDFKSFGPDIPSTFVTNYQHKDDWFQPLSDDPVIVATSLASAKLTEGSDYYVESHYTSDMSGATHVFLRQKVNGLEVINGKMNINLDKNNQVVSFGNSFVRPIQKPWYQNAIQRGLQVVSHHFFQTSFQRGNDYYKDVYGEQQYRFIETPALLSPEEAVGALLSTVRLRLPDPTVSVDPTTFIPMTTFTSTDNKNDQEILFYEQVPFAINPVRARRAYMQLNSGHLAQVWDVEIEMDDHWYNAQVNAHDGTLVSLVDWVADASDVYYNVIPFGFNDPSATDQVMVHNPHDTWASPEGWHAQGTLESGHALIFNVTIGNNAYAHTNPDGGYNWEENYRPSGKIGDTGDITFDYQAAFDKEEPETYEDAAVTNLFYWVNTAHDLFYRYGFDEKAGNFQQDNLGRGRPGDDCAGDAVIANAQDGSGRNNANFATPPDGRHGKMRMYVWDQTSPMRDGDFESGIIIHEYTHGVSNRLTGSPKDSNCLGWGEAGGMGEGWGDFVATIIRMTEKDTRESEFGMGDWANGGDGIRKYKYSTSMETNPSTYKIMDRFDYWGVHAKGEVWAEMLYEVYWNLVDKHGYTSEWFPPVPDKDGDLTQAKEHILSHGNTLALKLVIEGMMHQPCNPTFTDARDAILLADKQLTGGDNYCEIYQAFAKRGLGYKAGLTKEGPWLERRQESFSVEPGLCESVPGDGLF